MKKSLRNKIRQDEVLTGVDHARVWLGAHGQEARLTALVVGVLLAATLGIASYQSHRRQQGEQALAEALEIFHSPVQSELTEGAPKPAGTVYSTAAEKYRQATAAFDGVERRYGNTLVGRRARYYSALCRVETGDLTTARQVLSDLATRKESGALEPALARLALADLHRRSGEVDKAVEAYRQLATDADSPLPRDQALMSLGGTLEDAHRGAEAEKAYRQLAEEFPSSNYAGEAKRRAEFLKSGKG